MPRDNEEDGFRRHGGERQRALRVEWLSLRGGGDGGGILFSFSLSQLFGKICAELEALLSTDSPAFQERLPSLRVNVRRSKATRSSPLFQSPQVHLLCLAGWLAGRLGAEVSTTTAIVVKPGQKVGFHTWPLLDFKCSCRR